MADIGDDAQAMAARYHEGAMTKARMSGGEGTATCASCGDKISPARRKALPSARTCIDCQTEAENGR